MKTIEFTCYKTNDDNGKYFLFLFYINGVWDEYKWTLEEALAKYPLDQYTWISIDEKEYL